jgi:hypothetical protein
LALPFWVGATAYLNSQGWINLTNLWSLQAYLVGISAGTLTLFMLVAYLSKKISSRFQQSVIIKKIPGVVLLTLGIYAFIQYFF